MQDWSRYAPKIRQYLLRRVAEPADADDLLQEVWLKAYQHPIAATQPELIEAWLIKIAKHSLIDRYRHARHTHTVDTLDELPAQEPDELPYWQTLSSCVQVMLPQLPSIYADALRQADLAEQPHQQIATAAGVSVSAIKSRVKRGREQLKARLQACCGEHCDCHTRTISAACCQTPHTG